MGRIVIPDSLILKLDYEISQWQEDDVAYDIIETIIKDELYYDGFATGYLMAKLEELDNSFGEKELIEEFYSLVLRLKS